MSLRTRAVILSGLVIFAITSPACAQSGGDLLEAFENSITTAVENAEPSVVSIARVPEFGNGLRRSGFNPAVIDIEANTSNPRNPDFVPNDFGAGVVIESGNSRYPVVILTNYHVVKGGPVTGIDNGTHKSLLYVWLKGAPVSQATIIAADPYSDLAVLAIDNRIISTLNPKGLKVAATQFKKGSLVYAFGNPYAAARDGSPSVGFGIISNIARSRPPNDTASAIDRRNSLHHFGTMLQISSRLELGSSGGPLLNRKGKLIGISTAMAAVSGYEQSAGYAIPFSEPVVRFIGQLVKGYEVEYGFLGVQTDEATSLDLRGLPPERAALGAGMLRGVLQNSAAEQAGLRPRDVILEVNGVTVRHQYDLMREVAMNGPWSPTSKNVATMKIWRQQAGKAQTIQVRPGKWPVREIGISTVSRYPKWQGISVDHSTARWKYLQTSGNAALHLAVLVTGVDDDVDHQIQQGDFISHVNDRAVATPAEFHAAISNARGENVTLTLVDGRRLQVDR